MKNPHNPAPETTCAGLWSGVAHPQAVCAFAYRRLAQGRDGYMSATTAQYFPLMFAGVALHE